MHYQPQTSNLRPLTAFWERKSRKKDEFSIIYSKTTNQAIATMIFLENKKFSQVEAMESIINSS
jgi:hypothetical protein